MMENTPIIDKKLLQLLVCPETGEELELVGDQLVCKSNSYDIVDGIPVMIKVGITIND